MPQAGTIFAYTNIFYVVFCLRNMKNFHVMISLKEIIECNEIYLWYEFLWKILSMNLHFMEWIGLNWVIWWETIPVFLKLFQFNWITRKNFVKNQGKHLFSKVSRHTCETLIENIWTFHLKNLMNKILLLILNVQSQILIYYSAPYFILL